MARRNHRILALFHKGEVRMKYLVSQKEMQQYDKNTIEFFGVPSIVLMERAALVTVETLRKEKGNGNFRVLVVAGCGNNGGDGLAVGRLLKQQGCEVDAVLLGSREKCSKETALQLAIAKQYGCVLYDQIPEAEYDIIIDAIFGIGLSREIEGIYQDAILEINRRNSYVCAIDIPSGIQADSGHILGCAVKADLTVTYGFCKTGQYFYPGADYCGKLVCGQMGIDEKSFLGNFPKCYTYVSLQDMKLPERKKDGNKGTFGKVLVIAGSKTMCGAAIMAAKSVFRVGAGMVRIITDLANRESIQKTLPEAMLTIYDSTRWMDETPDDAFAEELKKALSWADCILIGPGIGTSVTAKWLLHNCLQKSTLPMVIDADGLNLLAEEKEEYLSEMLAGHRVILTPHLGEFSRLYGCSIGEAKEMLLSYPKQLADKINGTVVCKDARTVVAMPDKQELYVNTFGNSGMATAGSGDVLAGVITGFLAQGMEADKAAVTGVCLHSMAGDRAAGMLGERSMMATDIIEQITELLKNV